MTFAQKLKSIRKQASMSQEQLASNSLSTLQNDFKIKIDDIRKRIDVDVNRRNGIIVL